jgi:hypothetical protein
MTCTGAVSPASVSVKESARADAVVKLLWLAVINIEDKRARERAANRQAGEPHPDRPARLIEGQRTIGWREALTELEIAYPGRIS